MPTGTKKSFNEIAKENGLLFANGDVNPSKQTEYDQLEHILSHIFGEEDLDSCILNPGSFCQRYCFDRTSKVTSVADYLVSEGVLDLSYTILDYDLFKAHKLFWDDFSQDKGYKEDMYESILKTVLDEYKDFVYKDLCFDEECMLGIGA